MTNTEKLTHLLKVLKRYAEYDHCYNREGNNYTPLGAEDAFEDGTEYGEILFARTLLEQVGEEFNYPMSKESD
jgi:hypothetical protein